MNSNFRLLKTQLLADFPSGSSIIFYKGQFYIIGDDATCILVLDRSYQKVDSVQLFEYPDKRIPKAHKTDFEGVTILTIDGIEYILIVGSAATELRKRICLIPLLNNKLGVKAQTTLFFETQVFINRIQDQGIKEINIEGVCTIGNDLLLGNRGNRTNPTNHIIITSQNFWEHQEDAKLKILSLIIPGTDLQNIVGLSELCYIAASDLLLITLTSENTTNAYDDGVIGDSYIGLIENVSEQLKDTTLTIDRMVNLSQIDSRFKNEKIEGICVEFISSSDILIHLIADNDTGESRLFTLRWLS
ncbi:hypothetical protein QNI16_14475 [Cytophagaceae bacterium YF14B1]|uniref:Uncharacterized protein n=1 Tax=Xanthocytophaga flava TaxID=3048013 RepID=A0AAE3QLU6_9BACT|nr:hypothetical protein [Xanthocytophaga flavus]MDJ1481702.1 hypothetical protein [Xanthocytophaga flavus]